MCAVQSGGASGYQRDAASLLSGGDSAVCPAQQRPQRFNLTKQDINTLICFSCDVICGGIYDIEKHINTHINTQIPGSGSGQ